MKALFLLVILLAVQPVVSERVADCWMNGKCRLMCKDDEENVLRCSNRKRCCILSRYLTMDPVTIDGPFPWTTPKLTRKPKARRQHTLRCLGNTGICRTSCRKAEHPYLYCRNYKTCCLQPYMKINLFSKEDKHEWSKETRWPKIS